MSSLKQIVEDSTTLPGRIFNLTIQFLIVLSLVTFSIETMPDLSPAARRILSACEIATVAIFTVEYALRILVADHRLRFAFSFFGLIDLLAILPFYLALGVDLRSVRALRFLRLFRILKLARYTNAIRRFHVAFQIAREEIILFFITTIILLFILFIAAVGIYYFENEAQPEAFSSIFTSLWWAVATLTTVGYGDVYPITAGGRIFTFLVLMIGLGIVSVPAGLVASALAKAREMEKAHETDSWKHISNS